MVCPATVSVGQTLDDNRRARSRRGYRPSMGEKSRRWLVSAGLLAGAAPLIAAAVTSYWQPCAGSMLSGSVFNGYRYGPDFSDACLAAMDEAFMFPMPLPGSGWTLAGASGLSALMLLAAAWLVLLPTTRLPWLARLAAASPALFSIALAGLSLVAAVSPADWMTPLMSGLWVLIEVAALVAMVVIGVGGSTGLVFLRYVIVLGASTAAGWFHQIFEYLVAISLSDASWDSPPGTGYFTVLMIAVSALATAGLWAVAGRTAAQRADASGLRQAGQPT